MRKRSSSIPRLIRWVEYVQCGISLFIHVRMLLWEVKYTYSPLFVTCSTDMGKAW